MKTFVLATVMAVFSLSAADARMGGGRSFGGRGSRGFTSRPYMSSPYRAAPQQQPNYGRPIDPRPVPQPAYSTPGGGFARGLVGGLAGGFLGSMLFRSFGHAGYGAAEAGGGGIGLLEILVLGLLGVVVFRMFANRSRHTVTIPGGMGGGMPHAGGGWADQSSPQQSAPQSEHLDENAVAATIRRYDPVFDPQRFKDTLMDQFFTLQAAWAKRDLGPVRSLLAPEIENELNDQLAELKARGRINKLENIAVREIQLCEAWQEFGKEFVTVRFYANLLDYTTDEHSGQVVAGSNTTPVKFEEFWTYARELGEPNWRLSAVENQTT